MRVSLHRPSVRRFPDAEPIPFSDRAERAGGDAAYSLKRQDMALIRRNAAVQRIEIDLLHVGWPTAYGHGEPLVQHGHETHPRRAEPRLDAARSPFFCMLA